MFGLTGSMTGFVVMVFVALPPLFALALFALALADGLVDDLVADASEGKTLRKQRIKTQTQK